MDPGRFHLVVSIFKDACLLAGAQREALLQERCGADHELRSEVEALLREDDQSIGPFAEAGGGQKLLAAQIASAGGVSGADELLRPHVPVLSGQYHIIRVIGEGGMGTVYEAEQAMPRRIVALKAIRRGLASREMLRRFEHEAHILGRLHHPGIAQVYEAGASDEAHADQAFIAMELVRGRPLNEFAEEQRYDVRRRLELMIKVCDAVQHAHQRGVIHRDLKPANILVEQGGQPKILDFGVARAIGGEQPLTTMHTLSGQVLGTLPYMSPEQVAGDPDEVDTRTDVYALGVVLFQLLAGRLPHDLRHKPLPEAARVIRDDAPQRLGTARPELRGELETIVARAIDKNRERRYQSAADLGNDLRRFLNGEPVDAKRDSALYVLRKSLSRYRGVVAIALSLVATLAVFGVVSYIQARENELLASERAQQRDRADAEAAKLRRTLYLSRIGFAHAAMLAQNDARFRRLLGECPVELRGWEWHYLNRLADRSLATVSTGDGHVSDASISGDGRSVAVARIDGEILIFDAADGRRIACIRLASPVASVLLNHDGTRLFAGTEDGGLAACELPSGRQVVSLAYEPAAAPAVEKPVIRALAFADGGRTLLAGGGDGVVRAFDAESGDATWAIHAHDHGVTDFCPLGSHRLYTAGRDHTIRLWDTSTRTELRAMVGHGLPVHALAASTDGSLLASGGLDSDVHLWDAASGLELARLPGHGGAIWALEFSPDGRFLYSVGEDRHVRAWDVASRALAHTLRGHSEAIMFVGTMPRRGQYLTCDYAGNIKWWSCPPGDETPTIETGAENAICMALSADGGSVVSGGTGQVLRRFSVDERELLETYEGHTGAIYSVDLSDSGQWLVSAGLDRQVYLWSTLTGERVGAWNLSPRSAYVVRFSPDERTFALGHSSGRVSVVDVETLAEVFSLDAHFRGVRALAFTRDGKVLISGGMDGVIKHLDARSGAVIRSQRAHRDIIMSLALSPDERTLVTTGSDATVYLWAVDSGERRGECVGHLGPVRGAAFSPDGRRLATCGVDGTVRLWEVETGEEFFALTGHGRPVSAVRFSPDGRRLVSCGDDGTIRIWESQRHSARN